MSWLVTARVQKTRIGGSSAKAVLLALANFADDTGGSCFPSQRVVAEITELSPDTVQRQIRFLVANGFIQAEKERRKGHWASLSYRINLEALANPTAPCGTVNQAANCGKLKEEDAASSEAAGPRRAAQPSRTMRQNPSKDPFIEPAEETLAKATPIPKDFRPTEESLAFAISQLGSGDAAERSLERFRAHHRQVAGKQALSRDWSSRFRLWVDEDANRLAARSQPQRLGRSNVEEDQSQISEKAWDDVLAVFLSTGHWTKHVGTFGGEPGSNSCRIPPRLMMKYGFIAAEGPNHGCRLRGRLQHRLAPCEGTNVRIDRPGTAHVARGTQSDSHVTL
ncbi:helix-turn-helix domain-containing protein [Bradyrhizobium sp. HKCCYLRH3059]|uniref:helix-turn-helix domain-containing protein n=1 Tax=Bradyrhizobium sp. HKCCYLRH3059 TaxID=3420745 RepID=UPI003EB9B0AE